MKIIPETRRLFVLAVAPVWCLIGQNKSEVYIISHVHNNMRMLGVDNNAILCHPLDIFII
jgi:hypothetical protein